MSASEIRGIVRNAFKSKEHMKNLADDEDFFDMGVSSLTVVELQIVVEEALKIAVPTHKLMRSSTIQDWVEIYTQKALEEGSKTVNA